MILAPGPRSTEMNKIHFMGDFGHMSTSRYLDFFALVLRLYSGGLARAVTVAHPNGALRRALHCAVHALGDVFGP